EAEQRVANALEQAERIRRDADAHAKELLSNARRNADRVVAEAREHAERTLSDAMTEAERERTTAQRQVEDLNRQREAITSYLDELRNLLGNDPGLTSRMLEEAGAAEARFAASGMAARIEAPTGAGGPADQEGAEVVDVEVLDVADDSSPAEDSSGAETVADAEALDSDEGVARVGLPAADDVAAADQDVTGETADSDAVAHTAADTTAQAADAE